jgi:hypothetical protein
MRWTMGLHKIVLGAEPSPSMAELIEQAARGGVEIQDGQGKPLAFVLCPGDHDGWKWAEAITVFGKNHQDVSDLSHPRTGISTKELLKRAELAGKVHDLKNALETITDLMRERIGELEAQQPRSLSSHEQQAIPKAKAG